MAGGLRRDPLFVGLTRPTLFFGVSTNYVMLNGMLSVMYFIQKSDFLIILFALFVHLIGYIACFKEPLFMELWITKFSKCNKCANRGFHGANSYRV